MRQRQWRQTSVLYFRPPSTKAWYQLLPLQAELAEVGQVKLLAAVEANLLVRRQEAVESQEGWQGMAWQHQVAAA